MTDNTPIRELSRLINGFQVSQAIHVAAVLKISDHLAGGPQTASNLAVATGTHAEALYRLLRALSAVGVFEERPAKTFALTARGEGLKSDTSASRHAWASFAMRPSVWQAWGNLLHSVITGENAFQRVHGEDVWSFRESRPEEAEPFDLAMREGSRVFAEALMGVADFSGMARVLDVGGGDGTLLAAILQCNPKTQGVLFDLPHVCAKSAEALEASGVGDRCEVVAGDFFHGLPVGCDAVVLKLVLHDWLDAEAIAILKSCRRAMAPFARLLVVERALAPPNEGPESKFSDLNMLVVAGGRERSRDEFGALLEKAGFRLVRTASIAGELSLLEAAPCDQT